MSSKNQHRERSPVAADKKKEEEARILGATYEGMPDDAIANILHFLTLPELCQAISLNKGTRATAIQLDDVWKAQSLRSFPMAYEREKSKPSPQWYSLCMSEIEKTSAIKAEYKGAEPEYIQLIIAIMIGDIFKIAIIPKFDELIHSSHAGKISPLSWLYHRFREERSNPVNRAKYRKIFDYFYYVFKKKYRNLPRHVRSDNFYLQRQFCFMQKALIARISTPVSRDVWIRFLFDAVNTGDLEWVEFIVTKFRSGHSLNDPLFEYGKDLVTALYQAAASGYSDIVRYLLAQGADAEKYSFIKASNRGDSLTTSAFFIAVAKGHLDTVKVLADSKLYPNYRYSRHHPLPYYRDYCNYYNYDTAAHCAARKGDLKMMRYLDEELHILNVNDCRSDLGWGPRMDTPLMDVLSLPLATLKKPRYLETVRYLAFHPDFRAHTFYPAPRQPRFTVAQLKQLATQVPEIIHLVLIAETQYIVKNPTSNLQPGLLSFARSAPTNVTKKAANDLLNALTENGGQNLWQFLNDGKLFADFSFLSKGKLGDIAAVAKVIAQQFHIKSNKCEQSQQGSTQFPENKKTPSQSAFSSILSKLSPSSLPLNEGSDKHEAKKEAKNSMRGSKPVGMPTSSVIGASSSLGADREKRITKNMLVERLIQTYIEAYQEMHGVVGKKEKRSICVEVARSLKLYVEDSPQAQEFINAHQNEIDAMEKAEAKAIRPSVSYTPLDGDKSESFTGFGLPVYPPTSLPSTAEPR